MTSPAALRGREVRRPLLASAVDLIPERGWSGVSTRILAERAAVTPSVVHCHFRSVRALLNGAVLGVLQQVLAEVEASLEAANTPIEGVDAMLVSVTEYTGHGPTSVLSVEAYPAATRDEQLREEISELVAEFRRRLGRWLDEREVAAPVTTATTATVLGCRDRRAVASPRAGGELDADSIAPVLRRLVTG